MFWRIRKFFLVLFLRFLGVYNIYQEVCEGSSDYDASTMRKHLVSLLTHCNEHNSFTHGTFSEFLNKTKGTSDEDFFEEYKTLPILTKDDCAKAGKSMLEDKYCSDDKPDQLQFSGSPLHIIKQIRKQDFLFIMPTGGSTSLPLSVWMNKEHAFSMLFTFFRCWREMGWDLGKKITVFYPKDTYNIDEMARMNFLSSFTGIHIELFDAITPETVAKLVENLNTFKPDLLLVFPSPMNLVAHYIQSKNMNLQHQPPYINVSGETFFDCQRNNIQNVFPKSIIHDSYGSVELGEIAHETEPKKLKIFSHIAYIENHANEDGDQEMIITRLHLTDFPFIRYKMRDIGTVHIESNGAYVTQIEGKDSNYILSADHKRLRPSFFNTMVNVLNEGCNDTIIEVKVIEKDQTHISVHLVLSDNTQEERIREKALKYLQENIGENMSYQIEFYDCIEHDYRRKYRVIERCSEEIEYAGGIVGDSDKMERLHLQATQ